MTRLAVDEDEIVAESRQEINERCTGEVGSFIVMELVQSAVASYRLLKNVFLARSDDGGLILRQALHQFDGERRPR